MHLTISLRIFAYKKYNFHLMTFEEVQELLGKSKKLVADDGQLMDAYYLDQKVPLTIKFDLTDTETQKLKFRLAVQQSSKIGYKINFHMMDVNGYIGLSSLDINGSHWNPIEITDKVPGFVAGHASEHIITSHLHYYVEGYKPLAWALALSDTKNDLLKDVSTTSTHIHVDVISSLLGYLKYLNVATKFTINTMAI